MLLLVLGFSIWGVLAGPFLVHGGCVGGGMRMLNWMGVKEVGRVEV